MVGSGGGGGGYCFTVFTIQENNMKPSGSLEQVHTCVGHGTRQFHREKVIAHNKSRTLQGGFVTNVFT